jgi:hypothetical protein
MQYAMARPQHSFNAEVDERLGRGKNATRMPRPWRRIDSNYTELYKRGANLHE